MKYCYVTYLGSLDFLPGVLVLNESLTNYKSNFKLVVLVSCALTLTTIEQIKVNGCKIKYVREIENPNLLEGDVRGFARTYTKLAMFGMDEYEKIVYLDADMIVTDNIDILFEKPHMSAVIAGGLLPENRMWKDLNSGLMVIKPEKSIFLNMCNSINSLPSDDKSDQGFLHSFFDRWSLAHNLHLPHRFNIPAPCLDIYTRLFDFKFVYERNNLIAQNISVIHFWGPCKPWHLHNEYLERLTENRYKQAIQLWWNYFDRVLNKNKILPILSDMYRTK